MKPVISFAASLAALATALAPSVAAAKPRQAAPQGPVSFSQSERDYDALFSGRPAVQRVRVPGGLFLSKPVVGEAPQAVLSRQIEIDIRSDIPTLADLQMLLEAQGVPVTIDWRSLNAGADNRDPVGSFTAASKYQEVANSASGGKGIQASGAGGSIGGLSGNLGGGSSSSGGSSGSADSNVTVKGAADEAGGSASTGSSANQQFDSQGYPVQGGSGNSAGGNATGGAPAGDGSVATQAGASRQMPGFYDRVLPFRYFRGTVGELMRRLENTGNIAVWYDGGIVLGDVRRYSVAVLQNQDIVQSVVNELRRLGAKDVLGSVGAGQVFYSAPPRSNNEVIEPYLRRLSGNLSEVTMQVALVTVSMSKQAEAGFDWSALNIGFGQNINFVEGAPSSGGGLDGGSGGTTFDPLPTNAGTFKNGVFGANVGGVFGKLLSVSGAIKFLSRMGNTNIAQNVELRTLSGSPVILRSGEDIPYVSGVNAVSTGGLGGGAAQGSQTARLGTGLTLNTNPRYDSSSGIVTIDVGLKLVDLIEFVQLNAGQLGTLTQPRTREQGVNSIIRVPAGQTTILGGIRRDLSITNRNGPFGAFGIGSRTKQNEVFWLFAIVRPVVTVYETADAPLAPRSVLDTRTTVNPYDEGSYGSVGVPGRVVGNPNDPQTSNAGGVPTYYGRPAVTPANRSPAGVTVSAPPATRGVVVPGAGTTPEVNGNLPSGAVQRDPGAPSPAGVVTASTPSAPVVTPVPLPAQPRPVEPTGAAKIQGEVNVPQAVTQVQTPTPQPRRSFVRPMTAAEQAGGK